MRGQVCPYEPNRETGRLGRSREPRPPGRYAQLPQQSVRLGGALPATPLSREAIGPLGGELWRGPAS